MDKREKDKQLIKESIEHWDRLIAGGTAEEPYSDDCSLCNVYHDQDDDSLDCRHCPISIKTGEGQCRETPYAEARNAYEECDNNEWQQAATKMRDWLKDLYEDYES